MFAPGISISKVKHARGDPCGDAMLEDTPPTSLTAHVPTPSTQTGGDIKEETARGAMLNKQVGTEWRVWGWEVGVGLGGAVFISTSVSCQAQSPKHDLLLHHCHNHPHLLTSLAHFFHIQRS